MSETSVTVGNPLETVTDKIRLLHAEVPEKYKEGLITLAQRVNPSKKGLSDEGSNRGWNPPTVRIMQPTTRNTGGIEDLKQGAMFTGVGDVLGDSLEFLILYRYITHTRWKEGEFGGAPDCSSPGQLPSHDRLNIFGSKCDDCPDFPFRDGVKTRCNKNMVYWVIDANSMADIYAIQFSKTSYKTGAALYKLAASQPTAWSRTYKLTSVKNSTARGVYYSYAISQGSAADLAQQKVADAFYDLASNQRITMLQRLVERAKNAAQQTAQVDNVVVDAEEGAEPDFNL